MKHAKPVFLILMLAWLVPALSYAEDFGWMKDFNVRAEADPAGFRARLEARFKVGDLEIDTVFGNVEDPADGYMLFRLSEMSERPIGEVLETYDTAKGSGWGVLAKRLGIKPGSEAFHALKQGQDLYDLKGGGKGKGNGKGKGKKK